MKALKTKVNVDAPTTAYPFGNVRNNPGDRSGTPVDVELVGDAMQFFEVLMSYGGNILGTPLLKVSLTDFNYFRH